ncbi:unnamed protein product, partial [Ectocarpus sp. 6 AP-2014]
MLPKRSAVPPWPASQHKTLQQRAPRLTTRDRRNDHVGRCKNNTGSDFCPGLPLSTAAVATSALPSASCDLPTPSVQKHGAPCRKTRAAALGFSTIAAVFLLLPLTHVA